MLNKQWQWVDIIKPPQKRVLPDILTVKEVERVINGTRELRYQTFILTSYSMGLRLGETLNLRPGDIGVLGTSPPNVTLIAAAQVSYGLQRHLNFHFARLIALFHPNRADFCQS